MIKNLFLRFARKRRLQVATAMLALLILGAGASSAQPTETERALGRTGAEKDTTNGPLTHTAGHAHFTDAMGNDLFLTGSHTWDSLQDWGDSRLDFKYDEYLTLMAANNHNFIRLWVWEGTSIGDPGLPSEDITPLPWVENTSGKFDLYNGDLGQPFDFNKVIFNQAYFDRLYSRVQMAGTQGIYVSVMLFEGFSVYKKSHLDWCPWNFHPFKQSNNLDNVNGDIDGTGHSSCGGSDGEDFHTLSLNSPPTTMEEIVTNFQKAYVMKVIDTLNGLDNVLYEISNESICIDNFYPDCSKNWQYDMINFIKGYQATQHPVGMTIYGCNGNNADVFNSPADWVSPARSCNNCGSVLQTDYVFDPPVAGGSKVVIVDTDHLGCILGSTVPETYRQWIWKSLTRGVNPILMDAVQNPVGTGVGPAADPDNPAFVPARRYLGDARTYAQRLDLASAVPDPGLCGTGYCLADPGKAYLVYQPDNGSFGVTLAAGAYDVEWFNPRAGGAGIPGPQVISTGGGDSFVRPFGCDPSGTYRCDAVLLVTRVGCSPPSTGSWNVTTSCTFEGAATAPADVIVDNGAVLTIANGAVLNIIFAQHELLIKSGSQVLVKAGGTIQ